MQPLMQVGKRDIGPMADFVGASGTRYTFEVRRECFLEPGAYSGIIKASDKAFQAIGKVLKVEPYARSVGFAFHTAGGAEVYMCWLAAKPGEQSLYPLPLVFVDRERVFDYIAWQTDLKMDTANIPTPKLRAAIEMAISDLRSEFARTVADPAAQAKAAAEARAAAEQAAKLAQLESKL